MYLALLLLIPRMIEGYPHSGGGLEYGLAFSFLMTFVFGVLVCWASALVWCLPRPLPPPWSDRARRS